MRALTTELLLLQLPMLQRLMNRLVDCRPTGAACQDHVVQVGAHLAALKCLAELCGHCDFYPYATEVLYRSARSAERLPTLGITSCMWGI